MSTGFKSRALSITVTAAFALALCNSSCTRPRQSGAQTPQTPAQQSPPSAEQQGERSVADSRWLIRVCGDARTAVFTEEGVLKKELPRVPRLSELSPDGSRLLEVRFANGACDIFVADADGSHARRIVRGVSIEDEAHWSRDGARVLYAASGGDKVFEVNESGNVLREFARGDGVVSEPAYTPDGRVSYTHRRADTKQKLPPSSLVVDDGATERVVDEDRPLTSYAWEPSGQWLAFGAYDEEGLIIMRELASGAERVVRLGDIDERLGGFAARDMRWRPDGGALTFRLSFAGGREKGAEALFGDAQLFVLYSDGRATWFDVEPRASFDWLPVGDLPQ